MFVSPTAKMLLTKVKNWPMNGTYKVAPAVYRVSRSEQLFVIGVVIRSKTFLCVYALLTEQTKPSFEVLFSMLKRILPSQPESVMCDFDMAAISAFKKIFPHASIQGNFIINNISIFSIFRF